MTFTIEQAARLYHVPLIDYGAQRGEGVLLSSGAGLMTAVMDQCHELRWCADMDRSPDARLLDFCMMTSRRASIIALAGWFSHHSPARFLEALEAVGEISCRVIAYGAGVFGEKTLADFLKRLLEHAEDVAFERVVWSVKV